MNQPPKLFDQIYDIVRQIPSGKVVTYGQIARAINLKDTRKVGFALHANPHQGRVPCHRVVNKDGRLAPNFAFGGSNAQADLLSAEGVIFKNPTHVDLLKSGVTKL